MSNIFDLFRKISTAEKVASPPEYIVAGLGNPGEKYANTRHNAGFAAMDYISKEINIPLKKLKFKSLCATAEISGKSILLMKPQTFMNHSGESIREAAAFYKIPPERIIVIFDDVSLPPGTVRFREKGSDGGHNGIKSIIEHLNTNQFPRIKIGVGAKPHPDMVLADWVLSALTAPEKQQLSETLPTLSATLKTIIK